LVCVGRGIIPSFFVSWGSWWSWSYGIWIYNYLCNQCLSPLYFKLIYCQNKTWQRIRHKRKLKMSSPIYIQEDILSLRLCLIRCHITT